MIHSGQSNNINCDIIHCKSLFPTVFKDFFKKGTQSLCRSSDDTINCINSCLQTFFPDFGLINSKTFISSEVCSYDIGYEINRHWNCIGSHFHRLITCMSISGSMLPMILSKQTLKQVSCKKFLEALNCPYKILHDCEEEAIKVVSNLFSKVFKASMKSACHLVPSDVVFDLPVTYSLNNSYLNTAACLDNIPHVSGNCFSRYLQDFSADELYNCSNTCEEFRGDTCLPSSLIGGFYIPVISSGKYSCAEDSKVEDSMQMQEPSKSSITYFPSVASEVNSEDSTTNLIDKNDYLVPSDEAKRNNVLSLEYGTVEASTLNYMLDTKETSNDEIPSISSSDIIPTQISSTPSIKYTEIDSLYSHPVVVSAAENKGAYRLELYLQYLVMNFIVVLVFL